MTTLRIRKINSSKNLICFEELTTGLKVQVMKENINKAIQNLHYWRTDLSSTCFSSLLYHLIGKADDVNKMKFFVGFPEETISYLLWYTSEEENEKEFFKKWLKDLNDEND